MFGQLLRTSESSVRLFIQISEVPNTWMRVQLLRVFRKYVSPEIPVEMLRRKKKTTDICNQFGSRFRSVQEVQAAYMTRPIPDEAMSALLWEYKSRGNKGYDLTERFFSLFRASSNPDDLVLDCFAGSGTTLSVASEFGRKWIGIDNSSEAIATTLRRFAKGCERMGNFVSQKTSLHQNTSDDESRQLSLFNLDESRFKAESIPEKSEMINNFALYATDSFAGELEDIMRQWIEWL
jgi:DNA methylase